MGRDIALDGRTFQVRRANGTSFEVWSGDDLAGCFAIEPTGAVRFIGRYANVAEVESILGVAEEFARDPRV
jgi:hypothetical protein